MVDLLDQCIGPSSRKTPTNSSKSSESPPVVSRAASQLMQEACLSDGSMGRTFCIAVQGQPPHEFAACDRFGVSVARGI
jgi:hypothetical protein